mgnify:CR=1 FL=1
MNTYIHMVRFVQLSWWNYMSEPSLVWLYYISIVSFYIYFLYWWRSITYTLSKWETLLHTLLDKPDKISKLQIFSHASSCCFWRSHVCGYVHMQNAKMQNACISSYIHKRYHYFFSLYERYGRQFDISNKINS